MLIGDGVAFVTGGASGIGRACVEAFVENGVAVMVADRDSPRGAELAKTMRAAGGAVSFHACDVGDSAEVQAAVAACVSEMGRLDFAVNCAGIGGTPTSAPLADMEIDAFDDIIATNLRGTFLSMRAELGVMERQGSGSVVNIASAAGLVGVRNSAAYSASKHGVLGLTKTAALDYAELGIRVNAICPGMISTPLVAAGMPPEFQKAILAAHPMGRVGRAEEIASAVLWFCSPGAAFTTGTALPIDGGMTAT
ncbi:MAG: SDR family oxidoreductase [Aeromicrobium sp.]